MLLTTPKPYTKGWLARYAPVAVVSFLSTMLAAALIQTLALDGAMTPASAMNRDLCAHKLATVCRNAVAKDMTELIRRTRAAVAMDNDELLATSLACTDKPASLLAAAGVFPVVAPTDEDARDARADRTGNKPAQTGDAKHQ